MVDINTLQQRASDPHSGVWVTANAGSGKTKVLTDRYLRLLLSEVPIERILCITFTKAAAAEMKHRIIDILRKWASLNEDELKSELAKLAIDNPSEETLHLARRLFTELLDKAHSINISTVHSFCQSILGRFPIESGIMPHFSIADETMAVQLLLTAIETMFDKASSQGKLHDSLNGILDYITNNEALTQLLQKATRERQRLRRFFKYYQDDSYMEKIANTLKIDVDLSPQNYLKQQWSKEDCEQLNDILDIVGNNKQAPQARQWNLGDADEQIQRLQSVREFFFTTTGGIRKTTLKSLAKNSPESADSYERLAESINDIYDYACRFELYCLNIGFLPIAKNVIETYDEIKNGLGKLDYDDLILKSRELLKNSGAKEWVSYKLDGGIDHILVDEAQDTNPEQWEFIEALAASFFDNTDYGDKSPAPSLFVVGDEKQSIYRFQRADVKLFNMTRKDFKQRAENIAMKWQSVDLGTSFRSSQSLLDFVDRVFGGISQNHASMGENYTAHKAFHETRTGRIELLAPFVDDEVEDAEELEEILQLNNKVESFEDSESKLAQALAVKVKSLITGGVITYDNNRAIVAGDIMILLRKRGRLMNKIIHNLKTKNVPVAGVDRLQLADHIAAQDLLALADFCLLPDDDLTCAGLLKSPFIGFNEQRIYDLCQNRLSENKSLWGYLCSVSDDDKVVSVVDWLKRRMVVAGTRSRYEFFATSLSCPLPYSRKDYVNAGQAFAGRLGTHVQEILQEFLDYAYRFESDGDSGGSLQEFLHEIRTSSGVVKSDNETRNLSEVRIMSIHAAKGLESPIVILPDSMNRQSPINADNYFDFWADESDSHSDKFLPDIPLWIPKFKCNFTQELKAKKKLLEDEEYHRLLYVAMTRARSHLYIYAARGQKPAKDCWYNLIANSLDLSEEQIDSAHEGEILFQVGDENLQTRPKLETQESSQQLPSWLWNAPPQEATPPRPMTASNPLGEEPPARSPLDRDAEKDKYNPREQGLIIHSLLQYLPDIAPEQWHASGAHYLRRVASHYDEETHKQWLSQVLDLMQKSDMQKIFSSLGQSEVPISGYIDNHPVSARIDRILIEGDNILIIDYKTSAKPPKTVKAMPPTYKKQMEIYKKLIQEIYPKANIETAIIWTHTAQLMKL